MGGCNGILLVDKPAGPTSFAIVDRVRRALTRAVPGLGRSGGGRRRGGRPRFKCGHAGSLDPLATGLLLLLCGSGTRLAPFLMGLDKTYRTVVRFGIDTDTHDAAGKVIARLPVEASVADLERALADFRGEIEQVPPVFSALKRDGQRLYKLARQGKEIPALEPRPVRIGRLELQAARWAEKPTGEDMKSEETGAADGRLYEAELLVSCSSGTYVRSLARDLGRVLGTAGRVQVLRRESIGPFSVAGALPPERLDDGPTLAARIQPLGEALPHLPTMTLKVAEANSIRCGGQPEISWLRRLDQPLADRSERAGAAPGGVHFQMKDARGELVAVGTIPATGGLPRSGVVFPRGTEEQRCD